MSMMRALPRLKSGKQQRFTPGRVMVTPGILDAVGAAKILGELVERHLTGDWGDLDPEDVQANENAVADGSRIMSRYVVDSPRPECSCERGAGVEHDEKCALITWSPQGVVVWIITEADRSSTTILLPEEY